VVAAERRVALVTGGGTGVGKACVFALGEQGYEVVLCGRPKTVLDAVEEATRQRLVVTALQADVSDPESVRRLFAEIESAYGRLDLLFNNAGINISAQDPEDISYEQWTSVVNSNLTGVFPCTKQAFRIMKSQKRAGGKIINNGSVLAYVPRPGAAPYTAAKHGVTGLTRASVLEGRAFNIARGQIDIGNAATELSAPVALGARQADGSSRAEPRIDVVDVARAIVYMASLPLAANVLFITVMATGMPLVGRG
jgi:NAD(P)-dependent dehydrogenase (short-subunit alcohol dehydrogenase family)